MDRYNNLQASLRKVNLSMASPQPKQVPSRNFYTSQRKTNRVFDNQNQSVFMRSFVQQPNMPRPSESTQIRDLYY